MAVGQIGDPSALEDLQEALSAELDPGVVEFLEDAIVRLRDGE